MSETTEQPEGTPPPSPEPTPTPAPTPSPESEEPTPQREAEEQQKEDRRIAQLRARLGAAEREAERQRAELDFYRRQVAQQAPQQESPEQRAQRERAEIRAQVEFDIKAERFHEEAYGLYADWDKRRDDLVKMGADSGIAALLVDMPGGVRVAGALADDPSELQRIAAIRSERGRAVALGKYAAMIEANGHGHGDAPARTAPQITRAPAPIRPVTGRAAPQFNEYTADGNTLVDRYMKQAMDSRMRR